MFPRTKLQYPMVTAHLANSFNKFQCRFNDFLACLSHAHYIYCFRIVYRVEWKLFLNKLHDPEIFIKLSTIIMFLKLVHLKMLFLVMSFLIIYYFICFNFREKRELALLLKAELQISPVILYPMIQTEP